MCTCSTSPIKRVGHFNLWATHRNGALQHLFTYFSFKSFKNNHFAPAVMQKYGKWEENKMVGKLLDYMGCHGPLLLFAGAALDLILSTLAGLAKPLMPSQYSYSRWAHLCGPNLTNQGSVQASTQSAAGAGLVHRWCISADVDCLGVPACKQ